MGNIKDQAATSLASAKESASKSYEKAKHPLMTKSRSKVSEEFEALQLTESVALEDDLTNLKKLNSLQRELESLSEVGEDIENEPPVDLSDVLSGRVKLKRSESTIKKEIDNCIEKLASGDLGMVEAKFGKFKADIDNYLVFAKYIYHHNRLITLLGTLFNYIKITTKFDFVVSDLTKKNYLEAHLTELHKIIKNSSVLSSAIASSEYIDATKSKLEELKDVDTLNTYFRDYISGPLASFFTRMPYEGSPDTVREAPFDSSFNSLLTAINNAAEANKEDELQFIQQTKTGTLSMPESETYFGGKSRQISLGNFNDSEAGIAVTEITKITAGSIKDISDKLKKAAGLIMKLKDSEDWDNYKSYVKVGSMLDTLYIRLKQPGKYIDEHYDVCVVKNFTYYKALGEKLREELSSLKDFKHVLPGGKYEQYFPYFREFSKYQSCVENVDYYTKINFSPTKTNLSNNQKKNIIETYILESSGIEINIDSASRLALRKAYNAAVKARDEGLEQDTESEFYNKTYDQIFSEIGFEDTFTELNNSIKGTFSEWKKSVAAGGSLLTQLSS